MLITVQRDNESRDVDVSIEDVLADLSARVADGMTWREQLSVIDVASRVLEKIDPAVLDRLKTKPDAVRLLQSRFAAWLKCLNGESSLQDCDRGGLLNCDLITDIGPQRAAPSSPAKVQAEATLARKILSEVQHGG